VSPFWVPRRVVVFRGAGVVGLAVTIDRTEEDSAAIIQQAESAELRSIGGNKNVDKCDGPILLALE
jgi:hypothetical protein